VTHGTPVTLGQVAVGEKTNEIREAPRLLEPLDLRGKVVTADAMHVQKNLARFVVDKGADYVLTVKDNQKTMHKLLAAQDWALSPPVHGNRQRPRSDRRADDPTDPTRQGPALPAR
jgi:hypothetical protein